MGSTTLRHSDADVLITSVSPSKLKISINKFDKNYFVRFSECETSYPIELVEKILEVKGPGWLCDEIARDESPEYAGAALKWTLLCYVNEEYFKGKRILDFGCGAGASTLNLGRMFPSASIVGIELEQELLSLAKLRRDFHQIPNIEFHLSQNPDQLSANIGTFDYIVMTGVYEHLLPGERKNLLPQLWSILQPGGVLFLHETPHRYFPIETHTTGLPLINYMPDNMAYNYARRYSNRNLNFDDWQTLLRKGIRGGTISEISHILSGDGITPILMKPSNLGVKDRIDLWYVSTEKSQHGIAKRNIRAFSKLIRFFTGIELVPYIELAFKKELSAN